VAGMPFVLKYSGHCKVVPGYWIFFEIVFNLKDAYETEKWGVDKPPDVLMFINNFL